MTPAEQLVQEISQRKQKNLAFFEKYFPSIHSAFHTRELKEAKLNIDPNTLSVELLVGGKALYNGNSYEYNRQEAEEFSNAFKPGRMNHPIRHSYVGEFHSGRFFHGSLERFLSEAGAVEGTARPYLFEHSLPLVVFLGCGLGLHVRELLKIRDVRHAILVEHDPDRFLASLYVTDWEEIITPYINAKTRSFVLSVGDTTEKEESVRVHAAFAAAWNASSVNVPFMPVQTVFYNHMADPFYEKVANRLNKEIEPFINVWGYYDDEVNQLNHVLHNFDRKRPILRKVDFSDDPRVTLLCGNGPSLDKYLDLIKEHREKIILISAGSTTHTLLKHDIYPDFVVTLESDFATFEAFTLLPREKARKVPLIGAAQIHPYTFDLFGPSIVYLKHETAYSHVFGKDNEAIADGTPSATNAALAIAVDLKLSKLFLVGLDYGFRYGKASHSKDALYFSDENEDRFKKFKDSIGKQSYFLENNAHGKIYTTPFYNTGRIHAQRKLMNARRKDVVNLSEGATIEHSTFGDIEDFKKSLESVSSGPHPDVVQSLAQEARILSEDDIRQGILKIHQFIHKICKDILALLPKLKPERDSIDDTLFLINQTISSDKVRNANSMHMIVRGTIWHWLYNYYALSKQMDRQDSLPELTELWKKHFGRFLKHLPKHYNAYLADRSENDPKLALTISDPEPDIERWLLEVDKRQATS